MEILLIILFNIVIYWRTLKFTIIVDDVKQYHTIKNRAWLNYKKDPIRKKRILGFIHNLTVRLYGGATFGINTVIDHALSIFLHTCICVLIYMVLGYNWISFMAAILYACNPANHQTSIWLNGRRYTINIILVLLMMLYKPWGILLYPITFFNFQVAAIFSPLLIHPIYLCLIPLGLLWKGKAIKQRIDYRLKYVMCKEQKEYNFNRLIIIVKSFGFYFFNMFAPIRVMINYPNLYWWGITKEKNAECYAINLEFWKGVIAVILSVAGIVYFQGYMRIMWIFMLLSTLQWSAILSAVQINADRYISLPNVFMMYFVAYFINMLPYPYSIIAFSCLVTYYLCQLSIVMLSYRTIDDYQRYQMFFAPKIAKPRFNRIDFYFKQNRFLTAWYLIEEGLQNMPNDFHFLCQASICLAQVGNINGALDFLEKAEQNFYLGQEEMQHQWINTIKNNIMISIPKGMRKQIHKARENNESKKK